MPGAPDKIRQAISQTLKKETALIIHRNGLEWALKNAEARECLAGWVGIHSLRGWPANYFPVGVKKERYVCFHEFSGRDEQTLCIRRATTGIYRFITKGESAIFFGDMKIGFFHTRKEARDFVKDIERRAEVRMWYQKRCRELIIDDPFAPKEA